MNVITGNDIKDFCLTGKFDIQFSVKPEQGSSEQKKGTLRFLFNQTPIIDIVRSSLKDKRINAQTGLRNRFESLVDGSVIEVPFTGGRQEVDPENAILAIAGSLPEGEREAYFLGLLEKANKV